MIRAIVFDCFGVLAEDGWTPFKRHYLAQDNAVAQAVSQLGRQVDSGDRSYDDMITETARILAIDPAVVRQAVDRKVPNQALFDYIASDLKPHYKIGLLTNASYDVLQQLFTPTQATIFDATAMSYELGLVKPDPEMYQIMADRLALTVGDCLVVDDQARHVAGAEAAGMAAIQYQSVEQFKTALAPFLTHA